MLIRSTGNMEKPVEVLAKVGRSLSSATWGCLLLLGLAGLLVYANNYQGEFIFDDFAAIVNNPEVQALSPVGPLLKPSVDSPLAARPVAAISFALNYAWGGLDVRGYHLVNNLIHLLAAWLLFGLVRCTLLLPRFAQTHGAGANGYGLVVALIWLVHPLNTEAVDYLVCRTELLVGVFYLATMFFAAMAFRRPRPRNCLAAAVAACALGMGSKEVMASAPLMVLLYDRLFVAGSFAAALRQRRGFYAALAATWLVVAFYQLDDPRRGSVLFDSAKLSILDYFRTQLTVIMHYLRLSFWPTHLVMDSQDWPVIREFSAALIVPLAVLGSAALLTVVGIFRGAWWSILGAWFFSILAPTSSFIPIVSEIVSERRMYLPLVSVIALVAFSADSLWRWMVGRYRLGNLAARLVPGLLLIGLLVILGSMTFTRNRDYRRESTIWAATVAERPGNSRAHFHLGLALMSERRWAEAMQSFKEVIRHYGDYIPDSKLAGEFSNIKAVTPNDDALICFDRGNTYLRGNDVENAAMAFDQAITLEPRFAAAYGKLGSILGQQGNTVEAEQYFRKALELAPQEVNSYLTLADLLSSQGRLDEAGFLYLLGIRRGVKPADELVGSFERFIREHPAAGDLFSLR